MPRLVLLTASLAMERAEGPNGVTVNRARLWNLPHHTVACEEKESYCLLGDHSPSFVPLPWTLPFF